jgi:hypothetical protein
MGAQEFPWCAPTEGGRLEFHRSPCARGLTSGRPYVIIGSYYRTIWYASSFQTYPQIR